MLYLVEKLTNGCWKAVSVSLDRERVSHAFARLSADTEAPALRLVECRYGHGATTQRKILATHGAEATTCGTVDAVLPAGLTPELLPECAPETTVVTAVSRQEAVPIPALPEAEVSPLLLVTFAPPLRSRFNVLRAFVYGCLFFAFALLYRGSLDDVLTRMHAETADLPEGAQTRIVSDVSVNEEQVAGGPLRENLPLSLPSTGPVETLLPVASESTGAPVAAPAVTRTPARSAPPPVAPRLTTVPATPAPVAPAPAPVASAPAPVAPAPAPVAPAIEKTDKAEKSDSKEAEKLPAAAAVVPAAPVSPTASIPAPVTERESAPVATAPAPLPPGTPATATSPTTETASPASVTPPATAGAVPTETAPAMPSASPETPAAVAPVAPATAEAAAAPATSTTVTDTAPPVAPSVPAAEAAAAPVATPAPPVDSTVLAHTVCRNSALQRSRFSSRPKGTAEFRSTETGGKVRVEGQDVEFRNVFQEWLPVRYVCEYDLASGTISRLEMKLATP